VRRVKEPDEDADAGHVASPNWYPDPVAPGLLRYWDGLAWTSHTRASDADVVPKQPPDRRRLVFAIVGVSVLVCVLAIVGARVVGFKASVFTIQTGDNTVAEFAYSQTVRADVDAMNTAAQGLHPVCDAGGQRQGCYDADQRMIATLDTIITSLGRQAVPPRYAPPHQRLVAALTLGMKGFALRNTAIVNGHDADWKQSNAEIQQATSAINAALAEYPKGTVVANG
jgi:hypothetical protein